MVPWSFSSLRVPLLILRNFFFLGYLFSCQEFNSLGLIGGGTCSSWVVCVPGVWVLVWYYVGGCTRMLSSPFNTFPRMSDSGYAG